MSMSPDLFEKCIQNKQRYFNQITDLLEQYRAMPGLEGAAGPHMICNNKPVITWTYNDYLGLTNHPVNREIECAVAKSGPANSPMGSRLLTNNPAFNEFESAFSAYVGREDTAAFATGYLAAIGLIPALVGPGDLILLDAEGHSSLYDAAKLAMANGAKFRVFKHNDMVDLEAALKFARRDPNIGILIVCDGVYSMSGDLAKLDEIVKLKEKYQARLLVDDAHGGGVMGNQGKGTPHYFGVHQQVDLLLNTFSKAFGSVGGAISGPKEIIRYIRNNARTYIFSHNMQLIFVKKILNSLQLIQTQPDLLTRLWANTHYLQAELRAHQFDLGATASPITPVIFKLSNPREDLIRLLDFIKLLRYEYQIYVSLVTYPAVPPNIALIRMTPTSMHSEEDINTTVSAFVKARAQLNF